MPLTCHRKKEKQSWRDICWWEVQWNWSQQHQGVGFIQGRCSVVACGCRNRTMSLVWLSQNKHTANKGQPERVWGRAGKKVIPFHGARTDFNPDWEKAEFLTNFCGHGKRVWIVIEISKLQSNTLPHLQQIWVFLLLFLRSLWGRTNISQDRFLPFSVDFMTVRKYSY